MSSRDVGVDPVSEVYRRRVRFEWMAVGVIAVGAAMVVVASWTPLPVDAMMLFFGLLVVAVLAGGAVLAALLFRTLPAPAHITRSADRVVTMATKKVRRGTPAHPPQLQADAITFSRSVVRTSLFAMSFQPVLAASWTLQTGAPGLVGFLSVVGPSDCQLVGEPPVLRARQLEQEGTMALVGQDRAPHHRRRGPPPRSGSYAYELDQRLGPLCVKVAS